MSAPVAVGVDVGGTKTHVRVRRGGAPLADLVIPTSAWWEPGTSIADPRNATALIRALPVVPQPNSSLVVGAHGIDSDGVADRLGEHLRSRFGSVRVLNDAALVGPAAGYLGSVVTVIAGTGSIVMAVDERGRQTRLGGHGYLLGDEGSAPALARALAREILRAADRGRPDPVALTWLADAVGVPDSTERGADLSAALHRRHSITDWGPLAPAVFAAAAAGSVLANLVIQQHAAELVELVGLHLDAGARPQAVILAGGVVTAQSLMSGSIAAGIHVHHPELPVVVLDGPPVAGAIVLAERDLVALGAHSGLATPVAGRSSPTAHLGAHAEGIHP